MPGRPIRFRGKATFDGAWVYGLLRRREGIDHDIIEEYRGLGHDVDPETVGQYTGFRDAGNEEFYDGDIFEDDAEWFRVGWSDEDGAWYAFAINGGVHMQLAEFAGSSTCWKQGNIYENPELLGKEASE